MISGREFLGHVARAAALATLGFPLIAATPQFGPVPDRVTFPSTDGNTRSSATSTPQGAHPARVPAIVMMHGRAGAYSTLANGHYDATTLSQRHQAWGALGQQHGYVALLVDGFGPRGYPQAFRASATTSRPEALNEVTVRPLDAYGALTYLRLAATSGGRASACKAGRTAAARRSPPCRRRAGAQVAVRRRPAFAARWRSIRPAA